jgi:hypothetical protein
MITVELRTLAEYRALTYEQVCQLCTQPNAIQGIKELIAVRSHGARYGGIYHPNRGKYWIDVEFGLRHDGDEQTSPRYLYIYRVHMCATRFRTILVNTARHIMSI